MASSQRSSAKYMGIQHDQAAGLRRIMAEPKPRVVSILSASSTADQSRLMTNLAASIRILGGEVLIVHASQETQESSYEVERMPALLDVANAKATLLNTIKNTQHGFSVVKLMQKSQMNTPQKNEVMEKLNTLFGKLTHQYEVVLVDVTLNQNNLLPLPMLNESEILIKLTRHPESIMRAYTLIKQICSELGRRNFGIIVDDATNAQAQVVFKNISQVAKSFIQIDLEFFGAIPSDEHLGRAAKLGRSVIDAFPLASSSAAFNQIAQQLDFKPTYNHKAEAQLASFI